MRINSIRLPMNKTRKMKSENKKTLAELLKETRQEKNLSLARLSELTKIQIYYLEALEAGQFEKLPPLVYRVGIFKRLAKFLDLSANELIQAYGKEARESEDFYNKPIAKLKNISGFILTPKKIAIFSGIFLASLLLIYLWYQVAFLVGPPNLAINLKEDTITKQESIAITGKTDSGVNLAINGENVFVASDGNFSKDVQLADGINIVEVEAVDNFGKTSKIVRQVFRNQ